MGAPLLREKLSLIDVRDELVYSRVACASDKHATDQAKVFEGLIDEWQVIFAQQLAHWDSQTEAQFSVWAADEELDALVDDIDDVLLALVQRDRDDPHYELYFSTRPYALKRPVLGAELETLRGWALLLEDEDDKELKAMAKPLNKAIALADEAVASTNKTDIANQSFRQVGALAQFLVRVQEQRDRVAATLEKRRTEKAVLRLPRTWVSKFFRASERNVSDETMKEKQEARSKAKAEAEEQAKKKKELLAQLKTIKTQLGAMKK